MKVNNIMILNLLGKKDVDNAEYNKNINIKNNSSLQCRFNKTSNISFRNKNIQKNLNNSIKEDTVLEIANGIKTNIIKAIERFKDDGKRNLKFSMVKGDIKNIGNLKYKYIKNDDGLLIQSVVSPDGDEVRRINEFDPITGNKIKEMVYFFGSLEKIINYDKNTGKKINSLSLDSPDYAVTEYNSITGNPRQKYQFFRYDSMIKLCRFEKYSSNGNLSKSIMYQPDGKTISSETIYNDNTGKESQFICYYGSGKIESIFEFATPKNYILKNTQYKKNGDIKCVSLKDPITWNELLPNPEIKYDLLSNNKIQETYLDKNKELAYVVNYDPESERAINAVSYKDGKKQFEVYINPLNGNMTKKICYDNNGLEEYSIEYDPLTEQKISISSKIELDPITGNRKREKIYDLKTEKLKSVIDYDTLTNNKISEIIYNKDGETELFVIKYNPITGNKEKKVLYSRYYSKKNNDKKHLYKYIIDYSKNGNKIKKVVYHNTDFDAASDVTFYNPETGKKIRKIEFYDDYKYNKQNLSRNLEKAISFFKKLNIDNFNEIIRTNLISIDKKLNLNNSNIIDKSEKKIFADTGNVRSITDYDSETGKRLKRITYNSLSPSLIDRHDLESRIYYDSTTGKVIKKYIYFPLCDNKLEEIQYYDNDSGKMYKKIQYSNEGTCFFGRKITNYDVVTGNKLKEIKYCYTTQAPLTFNDEDFDPLKSTNPIYKDIKTTCIIKEYDPKSSKLINKEEYKIINQKKYKLNEHEGYWFLD